MLGYVDTSSASAIVMIGIVLAVIVGVVVALALYFLPTIIAISKGKRNKALIICLNIFLGWSFVGWIVSLILACVRD